MNRNNEAHSIENLKDQFSYLQNESGMTKSDLKKIRNAYPSGMEAVEEQRTFLASRGKKIEKLFDEEGNANWYDALEMFELYTDMMAAKKEEEHEI